MDILSWQGDFRYKETVQHILHRVRNTRRDTNLGSEGIGEM